MREKNMVERFLEQEKLVLGIYGFYYLTLLINGTSLVNRFGFMPVILKINRLACFAFFIIESLYLLYDFYKERKEKQFNLQDIIFSVLLIALVMASLINYKVTGGYQFVMMVLLAIVLSRYPLKHVASVTAGILLGVGLFIPLLSSFGLIDNYLTFRDADSGVTRFAVGFGYSATVSSIVGFASLYYVYIKKMNLSWKDLMIIEMASLATYFITDTRTYFLVVQLLLVLVVIKKTPFMEWVRPILLWGEKAFVFLFALVPVGTLLVTLCYRLGGIFFRLNDILSRRLSFVYGNIVNNGIHLFGNHMKTYGYDALHYNVSEVFGSNFIDSGYMQLIVERGIIISILMLILISAGLIAFYKREKHHEIFVMFMILMLSCITSGLMSNASLVLVFTLSSLRAFRGKPLLKGAQKIGSCIVLGCVVIMMVVSTIEYHRMNRNVMIIHPDEYTINLKHSFGMEEYYVKDGMLYCKGWYVLDRHGSTPKTKMTVVLRGKKSNLYYKMDTTLSKRDDVNDYYQKRIQNPQSYKYSGFEASLDVSKMIPDTYMTYIYYETGNLKVLDPVEHNIYL